MITHNMQSALTMGNQTIIRDSGKIVLDVSGQERENLTVRVHFRGTIHSA